MDADTKTRKGSKNGYLTGILYLAPAEESGVMNVCTSATEECKKFCLYGSGMARVFPAIKKGRIDKTLFLHEDKAAFIASLEHDIQRLEYTAELHGMTPAVRINGTSDLPWLARKLAKKFPNIQFYDYTAHKRPWLRQLPNYHLTFSFKGPNLEDAIKALEHGVNVAVVFDSPSEIKGRRAPGAIPASWHGYQVFDGDKSDLRFLDPKGVVVGLRVKDTAQDYEASPSGSFIVTVGQLLSNTTQQERVAA